MAIQIQPRDTLLGSNPIQTKLNASFNPSQTVYTSFYDTLEQYRSRQTGCSICSAIITPAQALLDTVSSRTLWSILR
jgi:hypothetical protein